MMNKKQIELRLALADQDLVLNAYNESFRAGYKTALRDVLMIKLPKAKPANAKIPPLNPPKPPKEIKEMVTWCPRCEDHYPLTHSCFKQDNVLVGICDSCYHSKTYHFPNGCHRTKCKCKKFIK